MTLTEVIMWTAVFVGGVSAYRNPSAAALVLAWMAGVAVSYATGEILPLWFYPYADLAVIAVIMCKAEQTQADLTTMLLYPVCWLFYTSGLQIYYLYYALWAITILQFLVVGWETLLPFIGRRAGAARDKPDDMFHRLAWALGYG